MRHRLNDDWAFGNDVDSRPWDFQAEECSLRAAVDRFNNRRYNKVSGDQVSAQVSTGGASAAAAGIIGDLEPVDNCINSVLGQVTVLNYHGIQYSVFNVSLMI